MDIFEAIAIIILLLAIGVLIYYFLENNPSASQTLRSYVSQGINSKNQNNFGGIKNYSEDDFKENESMGKKIKVKLSDIDMSSFNTDAFSKRIDSFLDEKSDQLIQEWSLVTKNDLSTIEDRFETTTKSIDDLEKRINEFQNDSSQKFNDLEKRIKALEED